MDDCDVENTQWARSIRADQNNEYVAPSIDGRAAFVIGPLHGANRVDARCFGRLGLPVADPLLRNGGQLDEVGPGRGGRRRENLSREEETTFLAPYLEQAKADEILVVSEIKQALDKRLGRGRVKRR
jgi:hypothetical protein